MKPWPYPRVIAHRGGGTLTPENTLSGMRKAKDLAFGGVEFDVMLTQDAMPILMHDETLERTTSGRGAVAASVWRDIARLDAGSWFGAQFAGETVPSFEQTGRLCVELGLWANVEIKPVKSFEAETGKAAALMARALWRGAALQPLLSSFQPAALAAARIAAPELPRGALTEKILPGWHEQMVELDCVSLHCNHKHLTRTQVDEIHAAGYWVFCYTVNTPERARELFAWGVDAFVTDRLDLIPPDFR
jgi:glycerophosphoryl diester phosphodiesterase